MRKLLSGNEALAQGAWEAGVRTAFGYPGTPSTEILENLVKMPDVYCEWSPNEKVALESAAGAAIAAIVLFGWAVFCLFKGFGRDLGNDDPRDR